MKYILFILMPFMLMKCEKDPIQEGIQARAYGQVYDPVNGIPISGQAIKIAEYESHFQWDGGGSELFNGYVATGITDAAGNYDISFETTGNGVAYKVIIGESNTILHNNDAVEIVDLNEPLHCDFTVLQLYPVNLKITLNNVDYLPIEVYPELKPYIAEKLTENNVELIRQIYVDKNSPSSVFFSRTMPDGEYEGVNVEIPQTNTTELTEYPITITNPDFTE